MHLTGWLSLRCLVVFFLELWSILFLWAIFLSWCACYIKGQSLRCSPGQGNAGCCAVMLYVGEGSDREQCHLFQSLPVFIHFHHYPQCNWALPGLIPVWVCGWVGLYVLGPCGSRQWTFLWGWEFIPLPHPPQVFSVRGFEAFFLHAETLGWMVCLTPQMFLPVCLHVNVGLPCLPAAALPACVLQPPPCCKSSPPGCPCLLLLPVWMNVSSLTHWLLDFHTVQFSVSSCCFLFLNLLSFFWLCEEAQCVYLHLHLG